MNMLLLCEIFYIKISLTIHINDFILVESVVYIGIYKDRL